MADDDDLLSRANSLINAETGAPRGERRDSPRQTRRRRSFLASTDPSDSLDGGTRFPRRSSEDDLPLLTDVVVAAEPEPEECADDVAARLRSTLAAELALHVELHLAATLPALLQATAQEAADRLRQGIDASVAEAARDFLAQRGQLQLALDEPADGEAAAPEQE